MPTVFTNYAYLAAAGTVNRTDPNRWMDKPDVAEFGVTYSGADDSAALQAAINWANSTGGGTVYISGPVSVAAPVILKSGVTLAGDISIGYYEGFERTFLPLAGAQSSCRIVALPGFTGNGVIVIDPVVSDVSRIRGFGIRDLLIDANQVAANGIYAVFANLWERQLIVHRCYVTGATQSGILSQNILTMKLISSVFGGNQIWGGNLSSGTGDTTISDCYFKSNGYAASQPASRGGMAIGDGASAQIISGRFEENNGYGLYAWTTTGGSCVVTLLGGVCQHNAFQGVYATGAKTVLDCLATIGLASSYSIALSTVNSAQFTADTSATLLLDKCIVADGTGTFNSSWMMSATNSGKVFNYNVFNQVPGGATATYTKDGTGQVFATAAATLQP